MLGKMNGMIERFKKFLGNKKGSAEIIAFALILIFIILALAPKIKDIGSTIQEGTENLNQELIEELSE